MKNSKRLGFFFVLSLTAGLVALTATAVLLIFIPYWHWGWHFY